MSEDPALYEINEHDGLPATKGDVAELARMTAKSFQTVDDRFNQVDRRLDRLEDDVAGLKEDVGGLKAGQASLERGQAAILNVLESIEGRLNDWDHIPAKVERMYKQVFPHQ